MMKNIIGFSVFLALILFIGDQGFPVPAPEEKSEIADSGDARDEFTESRDFIIINFQIIKIVGQESEEVLATPVITCENGKSASVRFDSQPGFSHTLEITPEIVESKDVRLKLTSKVEPGMDKPFQREFLVKDKASILVELFRNEKDDSQILAQITPAIDKLLPLKEYPQTIPDLDWGETMVLFNDRLVARGDFNARDAEGVYLRFWKSGYYRFSFHPFPGAKPIGFSEGNSIKFRPEKGVTIEWFTARPPLPPGRWLAWCAAKQDILNEASYPGSMVEQERVGMSKEGEIGFWRLKKSAGGSPSGTMALNLDSKMDFKFKNSNIKLLLEFVAKVLNAQLSLDPKLIDKKLTIEFTQVPLRQFLDFVCKMNYAKWELTKEEPPVLRVEGL